MDGTKNNTVIDYSYHIAEIEKKDREIAELKASGSTAMEALSKACARLSRLTAALNDNERAEKVAKDGEDPNWMYSLSAINDYRTEILKEVEK